MIQWDMSCVVLYLKKLTSPFIYRVTFHTNYFLFSEKLIIPKNSLEKEKQQQESDISLTNC